MAAVPDTVPEWLESLGLLEHLAQLNAKGFYTIRDCTKLTEPDVVRSRRSRVLCCQNSRPISTGHVSSGSSQALGEGRAGKVFWFSLCV
jgi:hypothetical protein